MAFYGTVDAGLAIPSRESCASAANLGTNRKASHPTLGRRLEHDFERPGLGGEDVVSLPKEAVVGPQETIDDKATILHADGALADLAFPRHAISTDVTPKLWRCRRFLRHRREPEEARDRRTTPRPIAVTRIDDQRCQLQSLDRAFADSVVLAPVRQKPVEAVEPAATKELAGFARFVSREHGLDIRRDPSTRMSLVRPDIVQIRTFLLTALEYQIAQRRP